MSEFKIINPSGGITTEDTEKMFITPVDLNITFSEYFRLKFEAISKGMLMSEYVREILHDEQTLMSMDPEVVELIRKLSSFVEDIDYYIVWGGDGFWRIRRSKKNR